MSNESEADSEETQEQQGETEGIEAVEEELDEQEESEHGQAGETEAAEESAEDGDESDGVGDGDFILLDYTARTVEDDRLVDTTDPEIAEDEGVDDDEREFEPRTIVIGEGHLFGSVEDDIRGKEVGEGGSVVVPAEEAFGAFDEEKVRTISKDKIPEDDRYPGAQVRIDGEEGFVETIIGGRARVDFNHPLAGDDIEYDYEVVGTIDDREEKAHGLLDMFLGLNLNIWFETETVEEEQLVEEETETDEDGEENEASEEIEDEDGEEDGESGPTYETVEVEKESLYIEATPQLTMNQQWMMQKQQIGQDLIDLLDIDRIVIQETIEGSPGMGMPGMMGGMGGGDLEAALEEADIDADDLADELE